MSSTLGGILALAVAIGVARLAMRWRSAAPAARSAPWRLAVLIAAQPICAGLLYLALLPPAKQSVGTLTVLTQNARSLGGPHVVALPEAPSTAGAERVPDLASALRRYRPSRLRIVGQGLEPRDIDAASGLPVDFEPSALPSGLVRLDLPSPVAPGATFLVGGRVVGVPHATVDLIDPAGSRVDTARPDAAGDFVVSGTARSAGPATFGLRVTAGPRRIEDAPVPVLTVAAPPARLLLLAGAPSPEVKYLRRWAGDAGLIVHSQVATGGGLALGDPPLAIAAATLRRFDLAILDTRSWSALSAGDRGAMLAAIRAGLGLLVRIDGPPSEAQRAALRPLGFALAGGDASVAAVLAAAESEGVRIARDGPGSIDAPARINKDASVPPATRWLMKITAAAASPLIRDASGAVVASWRANGEGRIALWPLDDTFRLVLAGHSRDYGEIWRAALATLGRGERRIFPRVEMPATAGRRVAICGLDAAATVTAPDGSTAKLIVDPVAGCALFWPAAPGWYQVREEGQSRPTPFPVSAAGAFPNVRAQMKRDATRRLAAVQAGVSHPVRPGLIAGGWPWALAWLLACAALWWFERSRLGAAGPEGAG